MVKAQRMRPELIATEFIKTPGGSILAAVGIGVVAFPYAIEYLVKGITDKGGQGLAYVLGALSQGLRGNVKEAEILIKANANWLASKLKEIEAEQWHEVNPDITATNIDIQLPGTSDKVVWIENMRLPPSADLLKNPADKDALIIFRESGKFNYYGVFTINNNPYWLIVPKVIGLYRIFKYKKFTTERQPEFCEQNFENYKEHPACYDEIETQELVWPVRWPGTTTI